MRSKALIISASCVVALIAAGMLAADPPVKVVVKLPYEQHQSRGHGGNTTITYHQGAVMTGAQVNVYVIYYGPVDGTATTGTQGVVNQFFLDLTNTANYGKNSTFPYAVNETYYDAAGSTIASSILFSTASSIYEDTGASQGTSVGSSTVPAIVAHAINTNGLPANENAVYFVVTAPNIKVAGFCKSFCAYHTTSASISPGKHIRYALVPDPGQACTGCDGNFFLGQNVTPNGNQGADEMTDSMIHELSETVTDPDLGAWYTSSGAENGDLCNYVYGGGLQQVPGKPGDPGVGAFYNFQSITGHYYLIQQIWTNIAPQVCLGTLTPK